MTISIIEDAFDALAAGDLPSFQEHIHEALLAKIFERLEEVRGAVLSEDGEVDAAEEDDGEVNESFDLSERKGESEADFWRRQRERMDMKAASAERDSHHAWLRGDDKAAGQHSKNMTYWDNRRHGADTKYVDTLRHPIRSKVRDMVRTGKSKIRKALSNSYDPINEKIGPVKKGALHRELGIPQDEPISMSKLQRAKKSSSAKERKRANFAINARDWHH